jgi:transposase
MSSLEIRSLPDPQVIARSTRRRFTVADKLRILRDADACSQHGQLGALLRREGIYSSTLASFRKQYDEGKLLYKNDQARTQMRKQQEAQRQRDRRKIEALEKENRKLLALVELQKKLSELMNLTLEAPQTDDENK